MNQPTDIVGINIRRNRPFGQFVPLLPTLAINAQTQLSILVLGFFQIACDLFYDSRKILPIEEIVSFQEDLAQSTLAYGVVFRVELVETVEGVSVRMDIQHVHCEVIGGQIHGLREKKKRS